MRFTLEGFVKVKMESLPGTQTSKILETKILLEVSKNLDRSQYVNRKGLPNKDGTKSLTIAFVHGLVANIHQAKQNGFWDDAEHLRYIISELEKGFIAPTTVEASVYE